MGYCDIFLTLVCVWDARFVPCDLCFLYMLADVCMLYGIGPICSLYTDVTDRAGVAVVDLYPDVASV